MNHHLISFASGFIFSSGLVIGGMTVPAKVVNFLDFAGNWDPSLAMVMAGAILVHALTYRFARKRHAPWFAPTFHIPTSRSIDRNLLGGALLFGMGWGLSGFCPGPALASAASGNPFTLLFVVSMLLGMLLHKLYASTAPGSSPELLNHETLADG